MKVLVDEDTGKLFADRLAHLLEPVGATVLRSVMVGWSGTQNGDLLPLAAREGYTHMITSDKKMADETPAPIPVLVVDQMKDDDENRIHRAARTVATMMMNDNAVSAPGYHAVIVEGYEPTRRLKRIAAGEHDMGPIGEERRHRREVHMSMRSSPGSGRKVMSR